MAVADHPPKIGIGPSNGRPNVNTSPSFFQRFILPGFAFKAVVIGGGYATGRELAEFFLPSGPRGGLAGMVLAGAVWSVICAITFLFALKTASYDYRSFFRSLLGRFWFLFEIAYVLVLVLLLSVFGAAAGEIGAALFNLPVLIGSIALAASIAMVTAFGSEGVEQVFKYVTIFLYGVYVTFLVATASKFGPEIAEHLSLATPSDGWVEGGITYASYNVVSAVVILPVVRHFTTSRDALVAGLLCGPLAMAPAIAFFVCMAAFYPEIASSTLPSDFILEKLNIPAFRIVFQIMIFAALLESGAGAVHAINQRVASVRELRGMRFTTAHRLAVASLLLIIAIFVADKFGLVALIAKGYRALAMAFLAIYLLPLLTLGVWRVWRRNDVTNDAALTERFEKSAP